MRSFILGVASGVIASAMIVGVIAAWADHLDYASSRPTMSEAAVYTLNGTLTDDQRAAMRRAAWPSPMTNQVTDGGPAAFGANPLAGAPTMVTPPVPSHPTVVCAGFSKEALDQLRDIAK